MIWITLENIMLSIHTFLFILHVQHQGTLQRRKGQWPSRVGKEFGVMKSER